MPSPIGERLETFPLDKEVTDADPTSGAPFYKRSYWEGDTLHTVARDPKGKKDDFVTLRRLDEAGQLIQTNKHGGVQFERIFARKES